MVRPEYFYIRFLKEWKVMERYDRAKTMNHRKLRGLGSIHSDPSWCRSSILEIKSFLSLGYRQDTSHVGILWPLSREKSKRKLTDLSTSIFSNSFSLKYSICHSAILWGSVLNPISYCGIQKVRVTAPAFNQYLQLLKIVKNYI